MEHPCFSFTSIILVILVSLLSLGYTEPNGDHQFLRAPKEHGLRYRRQATGSPTKLKISSLFIRCNVVSRYAFTTVHSVMENPHAKAQEAVFEFTLPSSAFISNFTLTFKDKEYVAQVKEKIEAKKIYDEARKKGYTAAHVATKEREAEIFKVSVNVKPGEQIGFTLTYEELLQRRFGKYEIALSVRPQQVVQNLSVEVSISERTGIEYIQVLPLRTSRLLTNNLKGDTGKPSSTTIEKSANCAYIKFNPTPKEQTDYSRSGIMGDFVVQYDVNLQDLIGDVQIYSGYFVHYFAPRGLPVVPKNVIFVIDVSGSMYGTKITQTRKAMHVILNDLRDTDYFNIITFSNEIHMWKPDHSIPATQQNVNNAKDFVSTIKAEGWTDINAALLAAASIFHKGVSDHKSKNIVQKVPLIIFLTDGEATAGVTSTNTILANARQALNGTISLFGLAFGSDADFGLLQRLSLENRGIARRIYEDSDATLQMKGFYDEVASPLLYDIQLNYMDNHVEHVTQTLFSNYFDGSELVVAGKVKQGVQNIHVEVTGIDSTKLISVENDIDINATEATFGCPGDTSRIQGFVQRLWAYFTIKELLTARLKATDTAARRLLTDKATNLSLKYNFVTPVTSLVIVKPEEEESEKGHYNTTSSTTVTSTTSTTIHSHSTKTAITTTRSTTMPIKKKVPPTFTTAKLRLTAITQAKAETTKPVAMTTSTFSPLMSSATTASKISVQSDVAENTTSVLSIESDGRTAVTQSDHTAWYPHTSSSRATVWETNANISTPNTEAISLLTTMHVTVPPTTITTTTFHATHVPLFADIALIEDDLAEALGELESESFDMDIQFLQGASRLKAAPSPIYMSRFISSGKDLETRCCKYQLLIFLSFYVFTVDGDPHFVVRLPESQERLCFTIDGRPDDIIRLFSDPQSGVTVNGHLLWAPSKIGHEDKIRTYLDIITVIIDRPRMNYIINITQKALTLKGEAQITIPCQGSQTITKPGLEIAISHSTKITIRIAGGLEFLVIIHHYLHPTYLQLDHLGFYVASWPVISPRAHGLIGQFLNADIRLTRMTQQHHLKATAELKSKNNMIPVVLAMKTMMTDSFLYPHESWCWEVKKEDVDNIIDGTYEDYIMSHLLQV
ncbi:inter-alpha-trypsin inhibitor heavy chain H6 [Protopterus annectens]|uniref:inter-alpha-trypsin inhibitor heavy chain H6 n=1 Tax=Protopterus annectens TaxID=7888 RepID=UPI001CF934CB|nr:inter-alpha-trypsin inhibitor heavy chain H6 [Protopterus annectens]